LAYGLVFAWLEFLMPRRSRLVLPGVPLHLIQRGNNRQICFVAAEDFAVYLHWLHQYADETGCRLHAYALMTNHVHLLISADRAQAPGALMKALGQRYGTIGDRPRFPADRLTG
jgi:putative transposase